MNRARLKSRYAYRPMVRYDVFPNALKVGKARVVGEPETFAQLPLPEPSRGRKGIARELVYEPFEESA